MPGKVNPVICESVVQVACQVVGCDAAIAAGCTGGVGSILQLNVALPMMASNLLTAIRLLANVTKLLDEKLVRGIEADRDHCAALVEQSLAMVTVLAPVIGHDAAAELAQEAMATGRTIRDLAEAKGVLPKEQLDELLNPRRQTGDVGSMGYHTRQTDPHERDEELQWADLLARGDAARGMALVFLQKLCTAFHEIGPAIDAGAVLDEHVALLRTRLGRRIRRVLEALDDNGLSDLDGSARLRELLAETEAAPDIHELAALAEQIHLVNHALVDALCDETPRDS